MDKKYENLFRLPSETRENEHALEVKQELVEKREDVPSMKRFQIPTKKGLVHKLKKHKHKVNSESIAKHFVFVSLYLITFVVGASFGRVIYNEIDREGILQRRVEVILGNSSYEKESGVLGEDCSTEARFNHSSFPLEFIYNSCIWKIDGADSNLIILSSSHGKIEMNLENKNLNETDLFGNLKECSFRNKIIKHGKVASNNGSEQILEDGLVRIQASSENIYEYANIYIAKENIICINSENSFVKLNDTTEKAVMRIQVTPTNSTDSLDATEDLVSTIRFN